MKIELRKLLLSLFLGTLLTGIIFGGINLGAQPLPISLIIGSIWMIINVLIFEE